MANILYGVAGQGFGHCSRSQPVIDHLQRAGHRVKLVVANQSYEYFKSHGYDVIEATGLQFVFNGNSIDPWKTVLKNARNSPLAVKALQNIRKEMYTFQPQLVLTDYERLSVLTGMRMGLPIISIDNQHRMLKTRCAYPLEHEIDFRIAQAVTRSIVLRADYFLITSFHDAEPTSQRAFVFPPLLREEILAMRPGASSGYLVAYLTSGDDALLSVLKEANIPSVVYGFDREAQEGHLLFRRRDSRRFISDMAYATAVVGNAGFGLISESLHFGKPMFLAPVAHQFEQNLNAFHVEKMNCGVRVPDATAHDLTQFMQRVEQGDFEKSLNTRRVSGNARLLKKLDELVGQLVA